MHSFDQAKGFRDEGVTYYGSDLVPHQTPFDFDVSNAIRNPFSSLIDAEDTGGLIHDYTDLSDYLLLQSPYPHEMANRKAEEHRPSEAEQPKATNMGFCQPVERAMFTARPDCSGGLMYLSDALLSYTNRYLSSSRAELHSHQRGIPCRSKHIFNNRQLHL